MLPGGAVDVVQRCLNPGGVADVLPLWDEDAGQGIGLSVAREIASAYGGILEIGESRLGGARLSVRLPGR